MLGHGLDTHRNGVAVIQEVVNLLLMNGLSGDPVLDSALYVVTQRPR